MNGLRFRIARVADTGVSRVLRALVVLIIVMIPAIPATLIPPDDGLAMERALGSHHRTVADDACGPRLEQIMVRGRLYCTHGGDVPPVGFAVNRAVEPVTRVRRSDRVLLCVGDGTTGKRIEVLYLYDTARGSRLTQFRDAFQLWLAEADQLFAKSAEMTGARLQLRFVTDQLCMAEIRPVPVSAADLRTFGASMAAVQAQGYDRTDRDYLLIADATVYCGIASLRNDSSPEPTNQNNNGGAFARVDSGCWSPDVIAHEIMHNLGAVQLDAPNSTGAWHCTDENDLMCYSDQGQNTPPMRRVCVTGVWVDQEWFDCNHDDYLNSAPPVGSYLDTHWNVAESSFLTETPQIAAALSVDPASGPVDTEVVITAVGLTPGFAATLFWDVRSMGIRTVGADGTVRFAITVPESVYGPTQVTVAADGALPEADFSVRSSLQVQPEKAQRGRYVALRLRGFSAGEGISVTLGSTLVSRVIAGSQGSVDATFAIPRTMDYGRTTLIATGDDGHSASTPIQIIRKHRRH